MSLEALKSYVWMAIALFAGLLYVGLLYAGFTEFMARISKKEHRRARFRDRVTGRRLRNPKAPLSPQP